METRYIVKQGMLLEGSRNRGVFDTLENARKYVAILIASRPSHEMWIASKHMENSWDYDEDNLYILIETHVVNEKLK